MSRDDLKGLRLADPDTIRYDAEKAEEFIGDLRRINGNYSGKADALQSEYVRFCDNQKYLGVAADAAKEFIARKQQRILHEGHRFLRNKLYNRYQDIYNTFRDVVDASPKARIDTDIVKLNKKNFREFYNVEDSDGLIIENQGKEIKAKFEKFLDGGKVTQPDYNPARKAYEELCDDGTFLDECVKKCVEFDEVSLSSLNNSGLEEELLDLTSNITGTAHQLDRMKVNTPDVENTSLEFLAFKNALAAGAFKAMSPGNKDEIIQLAKLLNVKCSLDTVVDAKIIKTATELTLLNCKTEQDRIFVQQCAASMMGAECADPLTIEIILETLAILLGKVILFLAEANPVAILITLLCVLLLAAGIALDQSGFFDKAKEEPMPKTAEAGSEAKEKDEEAEAKAQSSNTNPKKPDDDDDDPFHNNDAEKLSKMTRKELKENMPDDWDYRENNGRVHIRDKNGEIRIRIDEPETKPPARTPYRHIHIIDENGNCLDINGNIVDKYDPAGHIPYSD